MVNERIERTGAGGFLCPPGHPTHQWSVETDLNRPRDYRGRCSLDYAASQEWVDADVRAEAKRLLENWKATREPLSSPDVREWVLQCLGYFRNCYRNPDVTGTEQWSASHLLIRERNPMSYVAEHAGVRMIRQYYPEYEPTADDFSNAYWGRKALEK